MDRQEQKDRVETPGEWSEGTRDHRTPRSRGRIKLTGLSGRAEDIGVIGASVAQFALQNGVFPSARDAAKPMNGDHQPEELGFRLAANQDSQEPEPDAGISSRYPAKLAQMGEQAWTADGTNGIIPVDVANYARYGMVRAREALDMSL